MDLIDQARKYIVEDALANEMAMNANNLRTRVEKVMHMFKNLFDNGLPSFWNEEGAMIVEGYYLSLLQ